MKRKKGPTEEELAWSRECERLAELLSGYDRISLRIPDLSSFPFTAYAKGNFAIFRSNYEFMPNSFRVAIVSEKYEVWRGLETVDDAVTRLGKLERHEPFLIEYIRALKSGTATNVMFDRYMEILREP